MKLTCHSCGAKYTVSDDKIQGKTVKMKCRKCGATIVVGGAQADAAPAGDEGSPPAGSFLVNVADGDQRTMTLAEIVDAYRSGVVTDDTYVWADGMTDWQAVSEHAEVASAVSGGAPSPQASLHSVPEMDAFGAATPAASPVVAAAARKEPKASRDLFGEDRPSSGGLFGGGGMGGGGGLAPAATPSGTGKRDENSVLFSLSALTAVEASAPVGKSTAKKDDSGLIDLKALAASAPSAPSAASPMDSFMPDAGAVFPLGMPILAAPPQAAPAVGMDVAAPPPKSKLPIVIGGVVAIVAMVGVFFLVKGDPPPPPVPTPAQTAAPPPTAEPAPVVTTEPTAEPAPTASASAAPVAAGPKGKWPPAKPGTKPPAEGGGPAAGAPTPPKPPPAKSKCGCAANDLMCNMKCSAGK